jgi:predicted O-methyltransferase YrrM
MGLLKKIKSLAATWPIRGFKKIEGWLSDREALSLFHLARSLPEPGTVVEIGSWQGKSTYCLAKGLKLGKIHAIDPFDTSGEPGSDALYAEHAAVLPQTLIETFKRNLNREGLLKKVEIHKGFSNQFAGEFKDIDLLFIDGDHSIEGCSYDYHEFSGAIRNGGYLAFHDYQPGRDALGSTFVVDNFVRKSPTWRHFLSADSLIVFRRDDRNSTDS